MKEGTLFWRMVTMGFAALFAVTGGYAVSSSAQFSPPAPEELPMFVDQLRVSFEEEIFETPLTDGQWENFRYALAFTFTTGTDEQWAAFKGKSGQDVDAFTWDVGRAIIIAQSQNYLDTVAEERGK